MDWIKIGEVFGFPALIFAIWYIYHLSEVKKWESREDLERSRWESLLAQIRAEQDRNFNLLKDALDDIKIFAAAVTELKNEVRNHFNFKKGGVQ